MSDLELIEKIKKLKKEKNAIILAHNYQIDEIQDIADYTGDSLELAKKANNIKEDLIVFCGVYFMAETAKILNPKKTVLIPDDEAGCPMADMIDSNKLISLKDKYPGYKVVCYVNSTAEVKAYSDITCTSANAIDIVNNLESNNIIFIPDKHLGSYVKEHSNKNIILYNGFCPTHVRIKIEHLEELREKYPDAILITHPECPKEIRDFSDKVLSTGQMVKFVKESNKKDFIIGTEIGMVYRLQTDNPNKNILKINDVAT